jgi:hypothetical protein
MPLCEVCDNDILVSLCVDITLFVGAFVGCIGVDVRVDFGIVDVDGVGIDLCVDADAVNFRFTSSGRGVIVIAFVVAANECCFIPSGTVVDIRLLIVSAATAVTAFAFGDLGFIAVVAVVDDCIG